MNNYGGARKGAGRKAFSPSGARTTINARVDQQTKERLTQIAAEKNISVGKAIDLVSEAYAEKKISGRFSELPVE